MFHIWMIILTFVLFLYLKIFPRQWIILTLLCVVWYLQITFPNVTILQQRVRPVWQLWRISVSIVVSCFFMSPNTKYKYKIKIQIQIQIQIQINFPQRDNSPAESDTCLTTLKNLCLHCCLTLFHISKYTKYLINFQNTKWILKILNEFVKENSLLSIQNIDIFGQIIQHNCPTLQFVCRAIWYLEGMSIALLLHSVSYRCQIFITFHFVKFHK